MALAIYLCPSAMWETWVRSLGWEDPLEKGKATHCSILAWRIPWTVHGVAKSQTLTERLFTLERLPLSLSSTSAKINSSAPAAADIQHPLKGVQDGDSELGHSVLWENWQDRSSDS